LTDSVADPALPLTGMTLAGHKASGSDEKTQSGNDDDREPEFRVPNPAALSDAARILHTLSGRLGNPYDPIAEKENGHKTD
jgi:hypothetical protein